MRKGIIGVLAILAVALLFMLGMPYVMGLWIEKQYPQLISQIVYNNPNTTVKVLNYQRGWFSSVANVEVNVHSPWFSWPGGSTTTSNSSVTTFNVNALIRHGLIITPSKQKAPRAIFARALLIATIQNPNLAIQTTTIWSVAGNLITDLTAEKAQFGNQKQHVELSNLQGFVQYNNITKLHKADLSLDTLQLTQTNLVRSPWQVNMEKIRVQGDFSKQQSVWYGNRSMQVEKLIASNPQYSPITISKLTAAIKQAHDKDTTSIFVNMNADQVVKQNMVANAVQLSLQIKNLNTLAFSQVIQHSAQTEGQILSAADLVAQLYSPVYNLLMSGFSIDLNPLSFNTPQGPVSVVTHIEFPKQGDDASVAFLARNSQLKANIQMPRNWLMNQLIHYFQNNKQEVAQSQALPLQAPTMDPSQTPLAMAQMQISKWIGEKWLVVQGANFVLDLQFRNGQIYLNGQPYRFNSNAP